MLTQRYHTKQADTLMGKRNSQQQCDDNNHCIYEHLLNILLFALYTLYVHTHIHEAAFCRRACIFFPS